MDVTQSKLITDANGNVVQAINIDWANIQNVAVAIASAATAAVVPTTCSLVMIVSTTDCWFTKGAAPTAAADDTSIFLPAGVFIFVAAIQGVDKIAFIRNTADGTAQVIPAN